MYSWMEYVEDIWINFHLALKKMEVKVRGEVGVPCAALNDWSPGMKVMSYDEDYHPPLAVHKDLEQVD